MERLRPGTVLQKIMSNYKDLFQFKRGPAQVQYFLCIFPFY